MTSQRSRGRRVSLADDDFPTVTPAAFNRFMPRSMSLSRFFIRCAGISPSASTCCVVLKCSLATVPNRSRPCFFTTMRPADATAAEAPFGKVVCLLGESLKSQQKVRQARMDAAATARSDSAFVRCTNRICFPFSCSAAENQPFIPELIRNRKVAVDLLQQIFQRSRVAPKLSRLRLLILA